MDAIAKLKVIAELKPTDVWPGHLFNQNAAFFGLPEICTEAVQEIERLQKLERVWKSALRF
jgi:hypothetical protein